MINGAAIEAIPDGKANAVQSCGRDVPSRVNVRTFRLPRPGL